MTKKARLINKNDKNVSVIQNKNKQLKLVDKRHMMEIVPKNIVLSKHISPFNSEKRNLKRNFKKVEKTQVM